MTGWEQASDFIRAVGVVLWPSVIAGAVVGYRKRIGERISHMKTLPTPVGPIEFSEMERAVEAIVEPDAIARRMLEGDLGRPRQGGFETRQKGVEPQARADEMRRRLVEQMSQADGTRRAAIENLMTEAAAWGWRVAKADIFSGPPVPHIEWEGDKPKILFGQYSGEGGALERAYARHVVEPSGGGESEKN